jgi:hypothetical protein
LGKKIKKRGKANAVFQCIEYLVRIKNYMKKIKVEPVDRLNRPPLKPMKIVTRPGSQNMLQHPSRMGGLLYYPDGKVVKDAPAC